MGADRNDNRHAVCGIAVLFRIVLCRVDGGLDSAVILVVGVSGLVSSGRATIVEPPPEEPLSPLEEPLPPDEEPPPLPEPPEFPPPLLFFTNTALTVTLVSGMVKLLLLIVTPPDMTCHSLK